VKRTVNDLALLGGPAEFETELVIGRPNVGNRREFFRRLDGALDRGWLSNNGPLVREFESRVAAIAGTRHCVATCNATMALQLVLRAADLRGEIIVPSLTFAATAHAVAWLGLTPVFCDVDPRTSTIDAGHALRLINRRTSGILAVHLWGRPNALDELDKVARDAGIRLFYDAAHAFGATWQGRPVGGFGDAEAFSFHATKFVNSLEGGAIVTNDDELAGRVAKLRNFGITGVDQVSYVGINAKMSEAAAAMGLTSLDSMEQFREHNARLYHSYRSGLDGIVGVRVLAFDERERNNYQYAVLEIDDDAAPMTRDLLCQVLTEENVMARRYFYPGCHQMAPYQGRTRLPHTELLARRSLVLPTGMAVSEADAARICALIRFAVDHTPELVALRRKALTGHEVLAAVPADSR
jgi:dTDP-4-amino-4,6-dideoxyglucose